MNAAMGPDERLRRVVHILVGCLAYMTPVWGWTPSFALACIAVPANAVLLPHLPHLRRVIRPDGRGTRAIWWYPAAVAALLLIFRDRPTPALAGWLALGVGDGCAPFLAAWIGGPAWPWRREKRLFVSLAAGICAAIAILPVAPWPAAVAAGAAGAAADGAPRPIEDNVAWPFASAIAAWLALGAAT